MASTVSFTIKNAQLFPTGTVLGAYRATKFSGPSTGPLEGVAPVGLTAEQTAAVSAAGEATFSGLVPESAYYAGAQVSGTWRWMAFYTPKEPTVNFACITSHSWVLEGEVMTGNRPGFYVRLAAGESQQLVGAEASIESGTSATCEVLRNGSSPTAYHALVVETAALSVSPTAIGLATADHLAFNVSSTSGAPHGLAFTVFVRHES